jgi:hypothetical protein
MSRPRSRLVSQLAIVLMATVMPAVLQVTARAALAAQAQTIDVRPLSTISRAGAGVPASNRRCDRAPRIMASNSASRSARSRRSSSVQLRTVASSGGRVSFQRGFVRGVGVNVVAVDVRSPRVKISVMLAAGGVGRSESFQHMMGRARPTAAITGTFFGLNNREPTGDIVIDGKPAWRGFIGTAVAITADNRIDFITTRYKDTFVDWSRYETVIRGGPTLLRGREFTVAPQSEGFFSLGEFARHWRTSVGVTADNHLLLVAVRQSITLWELAKIMYSLGAWDAVALDGGTSTAMYYGGKVIARPGRSMTNVLLIYADRAGYDESRLGAARHGPEGSTGARSPVGRIPAPQPGYHGTGFEPAMPDPAASRSESHSMRITIEPTPDPKRRGR